MATLISKDEKQKYIILKFLDNETKELFLIHYRIENKKAVLVSSRCNYIDVIDNPSILTDKFIDPDVLYPKCESAAMALAAIFNEYDFFVATKLTDPLTKEIYNYLTTPNINIKMLKDNISIDIRGF